MEMCQFLQKFEDKQANENIFTFLYLVLFRCSTLIWQKCCTLAMTESSCFHSFLLAIHVSIKTKHIIILKYLFFNIFHVVEGGKEFTFFLFVVI